MFVTRVVAASVSFALILAFAYGWNYYRSLNNGLHRIDLGTVAGSVGTHDIDGKDQNLLIFGNDDRSQLTDAQVKELNVGRDGGSLATDSMLIVHIPANGSKATLISLLRDSYVNIPGYGMGKLNSAYADGYTHASGDFNAKVAAGANLLIRVIYNLTGLTINHFVQISLIGFVTLSDAVGGITINLCHAVDDTVAHNKAVGLSGGSGLVMSAGVHTDVKGITALEFVRQREGLPHGDLDRAARQRYFLTAAFRKVASVGIITRLGELKTAIQESLIVDQGLDLTSLATQLANLSANNIKGVQMPFVNFQDVPDWGNVEIVDPAQVKVFIENLINDTPSALAKAPLVAPSSVTVSVFNGGTVNGAATSASGTLTGIGFHASINTSPKSQESTLIEYAAGMESQAKTLAKYVPGAVLQQSNVSVLTLVLGGDGLMPQAPKPSSASSASSSKSSTSSSGAAKPVDAGCID